MPNSEATPQEALADMKTERPAGPASASAERSSKRKSEEAAAALVETDLDWDAQHHRSNDPTRTPTSQAPESTLEESGLQGHESGVTGGEVVVKDRNASAEKRGDVNWHGKEDTQEAELQASNGQKPSDSGPNGDERRKSPWQRFSCPSAAAREEYSPSRHGGESPPHRDLGEEPAQNQVCDKIFV